MSNNQEAVDTSAIKINIAKLEGSDYRLDFDMPDEIVEDINRRLKEGGYDYDDEQMTSLLTKICLDEGMNRLDKKSVWGPKLMPGTEPGKFCCDSGFLFSAIVDAIPTGILDQIDSIPIRRRKLEVTNELIETELFEQRLLFGSRESFSGEVAYGDEVTCNATLTVDGNDTPEFAIENFKLRIPNEGQLLAIGTFRCDEGEQLRGASVPGTISITLSDQQEKNATLVLEVTSAERITPCEVDEILKQYGTANETLLKAQIKLSLQRNFDRENNTIMRNQLFNYLAENITVPVSQRIIEGHWEDMCKGELEKNPEQTELEEDVKNELQEKAKTRTQRRVITSYFQEFFDLVICEEDVQHQISDIAESRRVRPEEVQEEFVSSDKMNVLGNLVMEKKIFDSLKDKMVFTDAT
jgi:FKBP-type peptidyl-prolyl cis-trans isomerase (trigger factor)